MTARLTPADQHRRVIETDAEDAATVSDAALARYASTLRRRRRAWFGTLTVVVVVIAVVVSVAWSRGEAANTSLHTVAKAPAELALRVAATSQHQVWRTGDPAAIGDPVFRGTVIVHDKHSVRGVDARTGASTWSYTRSNRTVCTAAQTGGTTIVVYELAGNCDEVTALDSDTGERRWTRTLDIDGQPLDGHPAYQINSSTMLITSPSVVYAIDPSGGLDRWTYSRYGCTVERAVLGTSGVLISQNCTSPRCAQQKFCGRGQQLFLRDGYKGRTDESKTNPDHIFWDLLGDDRIPVSADSVMSAVDPGTGRLGLLDDKDGSSMGSVRLSPAPTSFDAITAIPTTTLDVIWIGGVTYVVTADAVAANWSARTPAPPTVLAQNGTDTPTIDNARITVATTSGARTLDGYSGRTAQSYTFAAPPRGAVVEPMGTGFLVTSRSGTVAYA